MRIFKVTFVLIICCISTTLWLVNFLQSPLSNHEFRQQRKYLNAKYDELAPDLQEERILALDYWQRYPDVRKNNYWGENSRLGLRGPADHYRHHGRREGRIYARLSYPEDLVLERKLAEAYWQRNPDVAKSPVWGRESPLGILGARDHYRFCGKREGRKWGE